LRHGEIAGLREAVSRQLTRGVTTNGLIAAAFVPR
jgi:hypothetical protein